MLSKGGVLIALSTFFVAPNSRQNPTAGFSNGACTESLKVSDRPPDDPGASSLASAGGHLVRKRLSQSVGAVVGQDLQRKL
jgi:hypothetical protein